MKGKISLLLISSTLAIGTQSAVAQFGGLFGMPQQQTQQNGQTANAIQDPNNANVSYKGYSKIMYPVRQHIQEGNLEAALTSYESSRAAERAPASTSSSVDESQDDFGSSSQGSEQEEKIDEGVLAEENIRMLTHMETGTFSMELGDFDKAVDHFANAEELLVEKEEEKKQEEEGSGGFFGGLGSALSNVASQAGSVIAGNAELLPYKGAGFERVLVLNYKALSYVLAGDEKAYNVTLRANDLQNIESEKFDLEIAEANGKIEEQGQSSGSSAIGESVSKHYEEYDEVAEKVKSAYVNPFAYYLGGMIKELESMAPSMVDERDNALISYEKALELNPDSVTLQNAVADLEKQSAPKKKKLLHVLVADGFVPEKKVLGYWIPLPNGMAKYQTPIVQPVPTRVARVELQTLKGKKIADIEDVADFEALAMRHQKDSEPIYQSRAMVDLLRAAVENEVWKQAGVFGSFISQARQEATKPDSRAWMSLPGRMKGGRVYLDMKTDKVKLVSFDADGNELASNEIELTDNKSNLIYARSIDEQMYVHYSDVPWVKM